ncbi:hypothetical protein [Streptomyces sp. AC555_RSS877]|uniref:hypothetical protein n=1 Tax=Streptomyces sp. AC555_RSS877 TaxID=2823688 RepID=UPI001C260BCF|nr:hypothetical protein [Streptomyces sp. AC555_RSS877]
MKLRMLRWLCATVVCAGLVAAAVLTGGGDGSAAQPPQVGHDRLREATSAELDVLHRAEQLLTRGCMAERGFAYWPVPRIPAPDYRTFPYVVDDEKWAARHGYGRDIQKRLDEQDRDSPSARYLHGLAKERYQAWGVALDGPSSDRTALRAEVPMGGTFSRSDQGCVVDAWRTLYGDIRAWYRSTRMVDNLPGFRIGRVSEDPAFRKAVRSWSGCMGRHAISAGTPAALRGERLADKGPGAQSEDIRVATAEARCAHTSGLAATAARLDQKYADELYDEHSKAFDTVRRLQQAALPKARDIVRKG